MPQANSVQTISIAVSSSGNNAIVAARSTAYIELIGFLLAADAAVSVKWRSASTDKTGAMSMIAGVPTGFRVPYDRCIVATALGEALNLNLSGAVAVNGFAIVRIIDQVPSAP